MSVAACLPLLAAGCAGPAPAAPGLRDHSPAGAGDAGAGDAPQRNPLRNAYFGDLHVHSSWSLDAWTFGHPMRNDPSVAYRYGRGEPILDADGNVRGRLAAPLDFMAVTDHDNWLGEVQFCQDPDASTYDLPVCRELRAGSVPAFFRLRRTSLRDQRDPALCGDAEPGPDNRCDRRAAHQWRLVQETADAYYEPGVFTTFTAFEFSAVHRASGGWLHRNVFFRGEDVPAWGGAALARGHSPERLWEWMDAACTGDCDVIAIPHNTNYGGGIVLAPNNADGTPFTPATRDANSAALQKLQIVKGWDDPEGGTGERVYDVACDGGRRPDPETRRCADSGARVNLADCSTMGGSGAAELSAVRTDPEFDPARRAFYYVRVLENPTCRWTTWRALESGGELPEGVPPAITERAWSSPIWHTPAGS